MTCIAVAAVLVLVAGGVYIVLNIKSGLRWIFNRIFGR